MEEVQRMSVMILKVERLKASAPKHQTSCS
jgi:hypothetical protein